MRQYFKYYLLTKLNSGIFIQVNINPCFQVSAHCQHQITGQMSRYRLKGKLTYHHIYIYIYILYIYGHIYLIQIHLMRKKVQNYIKKSRKLLNTGKIETEECLVFFVWKRNGYSSLKTFVFCWSGIWLIACSSSLYSSSYSFNISVWLY